MIPNLLDWALPVELTPPPQILCSKHGVHGLSLVVGGERYCGLCFKELLGEPVKVVE
jgi:hypothetical protein